MDTTTVTTDILDPLLVGEDTAVLTTMEDTGDLKPLPMPEPTPGIMEDMKDLMRMPMPMPMPMPLPGTVEDITMEDIEEPVLMVTPTPDTGDEDLGEEDDGEVPELRPRLKPGLDDVVDDVADDEEEPRRRPRLGLQPEVEMEDGADGTIPRLELLPLPRFVETEMVTLGLPPMLVPTLITTTPTTVPPSLLEIPNNYLKRFISF